MNYIEMVEKAEQDRFQALIDQDYAAFKTYCDPALTYVHSSARVDTLQSYMDKLENQFYVYQNIDYKIENIVEYSDSLLVFGVFEASLLLQGAPMQLKNRTLSVWNKTINAVKLFAYQPTPIK
ncbi:nuclear transport factor 2 family protein [Acinetobacter sichuanensis]|uniref:nuclear transport factor 2 family protein n=1 Tax=Acinetobacter sichuanensis TaxID=2136183 RepID=UPI00280F9D2F|nr:nuclear transport factor 2 family protein [Acinetobacter sichuanensis]MDQ9022052.1 nuclear transport factor 2 family protein [Acinetobacter sichuanensis]